MRQIKFRAYHKFLKKMLIPEKLWLDDGRITAFTAQGEPENVFQVRRDSEDYGLELMQSTGLFDKNGKEMFSGDIIKRDDQSQGKWRRFAVVKISPDIQFDCSPIKEIDGVINSADCIFHYGNFAYRDTEKYLEIMGNIYENPELINQ